MRRLAFVVVVVTFAISVGQGHPIALAAPDDLATARKHYNAGRFDEATAVATRSWQKSRSPAAAGVLARSQLERSRAKGDRVELEAARGLLSAINPRSLRPRERAEWELGIAGTLYLSGEFGPAAEVLENLISEGATAGLDRDRLIDWWANAVDRVVQDLPSDERTQRYSHLMTRLERELGQHPDSAAAAYWMVAAARGAGDPARAWNLAMAGWVRAGRGAVTLRADLDRLVLQGVIPDLAISRNKGSHDFHVVIGAMVDLAARWDAMKARWASR